VNGDGLCVEKSFLYGLPHEVELEGQEDIQSMKGQLLLKVYSISHYD
jgi:hypothetical protein